MENTKWWSKKQTFFSHKCEKQEDINDGRVLRKYTNPRTNEPGEVWEHQSQKFNGLVESLFIDDGEYGKSLCIGIQGDGYVNVLKFKLFKAKGGLTGDIMKIARVIQGIDFMKDLYIEIWENFKRAEKNPETGKMEVPVYLMFKHDTGEKYPKSYPSSFEWDDENKVYKGVPASVKKESMGVTKYDSTARDEFYYDILMKAIEQAKGAVEANRALRGPTPAETAAAAPSDDVEEDVPF